MKLADVEDAKSYYSGKASDVTRQLTFAGIAVVWLLRGENAAQPIPTPLVPVLLAYVVALGLDIVHYATSTLTWTRYYYGLLRQGVGDDDKFDEPKRINWLGYALFGCKIAAFLCGSIVLTCYLVVRWGLMR